jgi:hypothetical protein
MERKNALYSDILEASPMPVQPKRTDRTASVALTLDPTEGKPPVGTVAFLHRMEGQVIQRAVEVIGNEAEALRWMGTPVRALNYATPISLLGSVEGPQAVLTVLGRLEHGIA